MATEWITWPRATDEELRSWSVARGDDAGRAARSNADVKAENQALRERAEAAESAHLSLCEAIGIPATALSHVEYAAQLAAARRAEAAAWNDAIEAAARVAEHERDYGGRDQDGEFVCSEEAAIWGGNCAEVIRHGIRALRLAAPTEGAMSMETGMEHIARDIREGRFPERSEPQMRPAAPTEDR